VNVCTRQGDRFPRLKRKNPPTIDDRVAFFDGAPRLRILGPYNKTGRRRSNRRERMHSSDVGDRFPRLKRKNQPKIDDKGGILVGAPHQNRLEITMVMVKQNSCIAHSLTSDHVRNNHTYIKYYDSRVHTIE
jgi:hypothetical protein